MRFHQSCRLGVAGNFTILITLITLQQLQDDIALNAEEQAAVTSLRNRILQDNAMAQRVSDEMVVQFLMARKFEEPRAIDLLTNSMYRISW